MSWRWSDDAGVHGNRLTRNINVAYDDYDAAQVRTQPQWHLGWDLGKGRSVPGSRVDKRVRQWSRTGLCGPITREGADGPARPEVWKHARSRGREGIISIFTFLIEFRSFVSIYLPGWRGWRSRLHLAPAFISKALGIVKCNSRSK